MRLFHVAPDRLTELPTLPDDRPASGFLWISAGRPAFEARLAEVQQGLQRWEGGTLVDLHVSDLLNDQLPSQFDYTSWYDVMVFRRLAVGSGMGNGVGNALGNTETAAVAARQLLAAVDTRAVGFAVFDVVLITVHPNDCPVREFFAQRLATLGSGPEARVGARMPASPADLMLRMVNHMVDSYLDLRRQMSGPLAMLQRELLAASHRFNDWPLLLDVRNALSQLEDTCEDQRAAVQEWIDAVDEWPAPEGKPAQRERELLRVRSRDVQEHIERVLGHVRRLEQSADSAVQMHFSALSHRTNSIMRTLTVLTAIFLPLNLITGFFGMNFDALPLIHSSTGVWVAIGLMAAVGLGLGLVFWRKRYLGTRR
jgi:magnesium transporter